MKFNLLIAILLCLVLIWMFNFVGDNEMPELQVNSSIESDDYDYYMLDMDAVSFNIDDTAGYRIQSRSFVHFPDSQEAQILMPFITVYDQAKPPWLITANRGTFAQDNSENSDRLDLIEDVVIHKNLDNEDRLDLYTEFMSVWPDNDFLATDRPVLITTTSSTTTGTGMEADTATNIIRLLADVEGVYAQ